MQKYWRGMEGVMILSREEQHSIEYHLQQAQAHLDTALNQSITAVKVDPKHQKEIAKQWEGFLGNFFGAVREKGKANRLNLLNWISFSGLRKW